MSSTNSELDEYKKDSRMPCRYGAKCYQQNPAHHNKYKHPPQSGKRKKADTNTTFKKLKLDHQHNKQSLSQPDTKTEEFVDQNGKKECISDSSDEEATTTSGNDEVLDEALAPEDFIKAKFLLDLPRDFYQFWSYCKSLNSAAPSAAFKDVGLELVGPFDVLANKFKNINLPPVEFLRHWRYYYDPPELLTVLKGNNSTGYHIGYFYDSPDQLPSFLVSNHGTKDGVFTKMGDNIFAAVSAYLEEQSTLCDPFKKMQIKKKLASLKTEAEKVKVNLSLHSQHLKDRDKKVVAKTSNKIGLVVPYDKKTQLGYRDLAMPDKELLTLLRKLQEASPEQKSRYLSDLQPVLTYANIALDECDFGTGVKLGWELLYHGIDSLDSTIMKFLCNSYRLLNKEAFVKIAEAHLTKRRRGCDLSVI